MHLVLTQNAEYFGPATVGRPGRRFCPKTKIRAGSMLFLIRTIQTLFSHPSGRRDGNRGFFPAVVQEVDFPDLKTMALRGNISRVTVSLRESWARSASRFPVPIPTAFMRSSRRRKAVFTVPMMPGNIGPV